MRTHTKIWLTGGLTAILALCAGRAHTQAPGSDKIAARVNGEDITVLELQAVLESRPSPVPVSKDLQREMRKAAIDMLVDDLLMRQFLRRTVQPVNPVDLQKEYDKLYDALKKQNKTIEQFLQEGKMTADLLRADIVARLQWKAYLQAHYAEADIKSYYTANKVLFDNVIVKASHILVKVAANAPPEEKARGRAKLEAIRQEVVGGKVTFEDAARKYSDCPSKKDGGDIGPFPYKFAVVDAFAQAAFSTRKGELTDIVATEFGFHLIKVTDRSAGEPSQFDLIRDVVREVMAQEAELYQRVLAEQKKSGKVEIFAQ